MGRELSELTLEELWEIFSIFLTEHRPEWKDYYAEQERILSDALHPFQIRRIAHIGSTAIKEIWAKPIIDILVEIDADEDIEAVAKVIERIGFTRMAEKQDRISFNRGYTKNGFAQKVYHLHLRFAGDNRELYFRDYLNAHPDTAKAYEQLKLGLWKQYEHNRDGYTEDKTAFIETYTERARALYPNRYGNSRNQISFFQE